MPRVVHGSEADAVQSARLRTEAGPCPAESRSTIFRSSPFCEARRLLGNCRPQSNSSRGMATLTDLHRASTTGSTESSLGCL